MRSIGRSSILTRIPPIKGDTFINKLGYSENDIDRRAKYMRILGALLFDIFDL